MTLKWEVLAAVWASKMPSPGKVIMARLVDKADAETAIVDQRWTPSQTELASDCSISKSTVIEYLDRLERAGWAKRDRPATADALARGERTSYRLAIGDDELPPAKPRKNRGKRTTAADPSTPGGLDRQDNQDRPAVGGRPPGGPGVDRPANEPRPPGGHKSPSTHHYPSSPPSASADADTATPLPGFEGTEPPPKAPKRKRASKPKAGDPTHGQRVDRLTKRYTDVVKLSPFMAVRGVVDTAVKANAYTDEQISEALDRLALPENRGRIAVTANTLRIEIEGTKNPRGHQPYRDQPADAYERGSL
ncbi:MAG TPA: helix-turn-helix domain-containing protein [Glycomyces sp.]|nr:helix-turn-helix domain-containing protein [Glycomyces sp.]